MIFRRWTAIAITAMLTAAAACSGSNPVGFQDDGSRVDPPTAPTDTSAFVPEGSMG
jgi:hypothetical protein